MVIYLKTTECHIFGGELKGDKVLDHCHFTGRYRGPAHKKCNLSQKMPPFIPIFYHNLSRFDVHRFIKSLANSPGKTTCIPSNDETYISISKWIIVGKYINKYGEEKDINVELRFLDSYRFM